MAQSNNSLLASRKMMAILALFCAMIWGAAYPMIKLGYRYFAIASPDNASKVLLAGVRFTLSGVILLVLHRSSGRSLKLPDRSCWKQILLIALFQTALQYSFNYIGLANTSGAKGAILNRVGTFLIVLCSGFFFKDEKITRNKLAGSLLGLTGIILVNFDRQLDLSFSLFGEGFVIISSLAAVGAAMLSRQAVRQVDGVLLTGWQQLIGGSVLLLIGFLSGGRLVQWSLAGVLVLLYLVFVSSAAYAITAQLYKYHGVARVSVWTFSVSLFGGFASWLVLGESLLDIRYILALILVSAGILLVNRVPGGQRQERVIEPRPAGQPQQAADSE